MSVAGIRPLHAFLSFSVHAINFGVCNCSCNQTETYYFKCSTSLNSGVRKF